MPASPSAKPLFDLKSTAWTLTALRLQSADLAALVAALNARFADSPGLFDDDAVVLDLSPLREADSAVDVAGLLPHLRRHGMRPIAAQGGSPAQMAAARAAGLAEATGAAPQAILSASAASTAVETAVETSVTTAAAAAPAPAPASASLPLPPPAIEMPASESAPVSAATPALLPARDRVVRGPKVAVPRPEPATAGPAPQFAGAPHPPLPESSAAPVASALHAANASTAALPTMVVDRPLRSGQRVYARGADLVVLAVVSFGAEVIADGNIHVYGPLRGRAIAGARGNTQARIFSTCMEPQLVSIAGIYRTTETPLPAAVLGHAAQVRLEGEKIIVEPLGS